MTKAPERIWMDGDIEVGEGYWIRCFEDPKPCSAPALEYVRADKLHHQTHLIKQLLSLLDIVEATDEGRTFRPNQIRSCRALDAEKLNNILMKLKETIIT